MLEKIKEFKEKHPGDKMGLLGLIFHSWPEISTDNKIPLDCKKEDFVSHMNDLTGLSLFDFYDLGKPFYKVITRSNGYVTMKKNGIISFNIDKREPDVEKFMTLVRGKAPYIRKVKVATKEKATVEPKLVSYTEETLTFLVELYKTHNVPFSAVVHDRDGEERELLTEISFFNEQEGR